VTTRSDRPIVDGRPGILIASTPDDVPPRLGWSGSDPTLTILLFGGADRMSRTEVRRLRPFFDDAFVPALHDLDAVVVDGGTDAGVMRLVGEAAAARPERPRLVGVAPRSRVRAAPDDPPDRVALAPGHSDFVLVPGADWGDEGPWLPLVADRISGGRKATVVANGGEIAWREAIASLARDELVVTVAGSGRTADRLAALAAGTAEERLAAGLPVTGRLVAIPVDADRRALLAVLTAHDG